MFWNRFTLPPLGRNLILVTGLVLGIPFLHADLAFPSYNTSPSTPEITGMGGSACEIASRISLGWNVGNSMEAIGGETNWGNPKITKALIERVKQSGFDAIRLPTSWNQHADPETARIDPDWLNRVKEVVQFCVDLDLYVILNIHWDGGWLENNVTPVKQAENNARQKAYWEQIATHFRDFDEHLLLASANEPNVDNAAQMEVLLSYHQTFIDAVRSTGGRNAYRVLVVQGPGTDIEKTDTLMSTLPTDTVHGRMMVEVHYYTPYNFTLMDRDRYWGKQAYYWGTGFHSQTDPEHNAAWGEEETVDSLFSLMKVKFVDKDIPVILGEFGAMRRSNLTGDNLALHLEARAHYHRYVTQRANANGIVPFYWDNGGTGNHSFGIFNRETATVADQKIVDALTVEVTNSFWKAHECESRASANPDSDWASNLLELYLGSDPTTSDSIPALPAVSIDTEGKLVYRLHRFARCQASVEFRSSPDLVNWNPLPMNIRKDTDTVLEFVSQESVPIGIFNRMIVSAE